MGVMSDLNLRAAESAGDDSLDGRPKTREARLALAEMYLSDMDRHVQSADFGTRQWAQANQRRLRLEIADLRAQITNCPICYPTPCPPRGVEPLVPNGDGSYTRHVARSFYTNAYDNACPWQEQDARRATAYLTGEAK